MLQYHVTRKDGQVVNVTTCPADGMTYTTTGDQIAYSTRIETMLIKEFDTDTDEGENVGQIETSCVHTFTAEDTKGIKGHEPGEDTALQLAIAFAQWLGEKYEYDDQNVRRAINRLLKREGS